MTKLCCTCKLEKSDFYKNKSSKDNLSSQCKSCAKLYRDSHKNIKYASSSKEYKQSYYINNLDQINKTRKTWLEKNKEKLSIQAKARYIRNRIKFLHIFKTYYVNNKSKILARYKKYRSDNRYYIYLLNRKRRKLLKGDVTKQEIQALIIKSKNICYYCGIILNNNMHVDHYIPLSKGGLHTISNLVISCKDCNLRKANKMPQEFKTLDKEKQ